LPLDGAFPPRNNGGKSRRMPAWPRSHASYPGGELELQRDCHQGPRRGARANTVRGRTRNECVTLKEGPFGIETQEHVDSVALPLRRLVAQSNSVDAFVIACYSDPTARVGAMNIAVVSSACRLRCAASRARSGQGFREHVEERERGRIDDALWGKGRHQRDRARHHQSAQQLVALPRLEIGRSRG
jgi:hypothetical protein